MDNRYAQIVTFFSIKKPDVRNDELLSKRTKMAFFCQILKKTLAQNNFLIMLLQYAI